MTDYPCNADGESSKLTKKQLAVIKDHIDALLEQISHTEMFGKDNGPGGEDLAMELYSLLSEAQEYIEEHSIHEPTPKSAGKKHAKSPQFGFVAANGKIFRAYDTDDKDVEWPDWSLRGSREPTELTKVEEYSTAYALGLFGRAESALLPFELGFGKTRAHRVTKTETQPTVVDPSAFIEL